MTDQVDDRPLVPDATGDRVASATGFVAMLASLAAFAGASCCVLPMALAIVGLGGGWVLIFDQVSVYGERLLLIAAVVVALGWALLAWRRFAPAPACADGTCAPRSVRPLALILLAIATATLAGAWLVIAHEGTLTRWLFDLRLWLRYG